MKRRVLVDESHVLTFRALAADFALRNAHKTQVVAVVCEVLAEFEDAWRRGISEHEQRMEESN